VFLAMEVSMAYASAGWIMRIVLLFHSSVGCTMLYFIWLRILSGRRGYWAASVIVYITAACISFYIISPLLAC
jgi:hypothetical protein